MDNDWRVAETTEIKFVFLKCSAGKSADRDKRIALYIHVRASGALAPTDRGLSTSPQYIRTHTTLAVGLLLTTRSLRALSLGTAASAPSENCAVLYKHTHTNYSYTAAAVLLQKVRERESFKLNIYLADIPLVVSSPPQSPDFSYSVLRGKTFRRAKI